MSNLIILKQQSRKSLEFVNIEWFTLF